MMLASLLLASMQAPSTVDPKSASECEQSIVKLIDAADAQSRLVITFTGSQKALLPLDERAGGGIESTLFPATKNLFILTLQLRPALAKPADLPAFARGVCSLAISQGGRFNGAMSFRRESTTTNDGRALTRERMTDALMAELPNN